MKRLIFAIMTSFLVFSACGTDNDLSSNDDEEMVEVRESRNKEKEELDENESESEDTNVEEWMKSKALENIEKINVLSNDENYIEYTTASSELMDIIAEWSDASIDKDSPILVVDTELDSINSFLALNGITDAKLSDVAEEMLKSRMGSSIPSMINGQMGANYLAASSVLFYGKGYVTDLKFNSQLWVVPTDKEGLAYAVNFQRSDEGIASVSVSYLCYKNESTLKKSLKPMLMSFDVEEYDINWDK